MLPKFQLYPLADSIAAVEARRLASGPPTQRTNLEPDSGATKREEDDPLHRVALANRAREAELFPSFSFPKIDLHPFPAAIAAVEAWKLPEEVEKDSAIWMKEMKRRLAVVRRIYFFAFAWFAQLFKLVYSAVSPSKSLWAWDHHQYQ